MNEFGSEKEFASVARDANNTNKADTKADVDVGRQQLAEGIGGQTKVSPRNSKIIWNCRKSNHNHSQPLWREDIHLIMQEILQDGEEICTDAMQHLDKPNPFAIKIL